MIILTIGIAKTNDKENGMDASSERGSDDIR